jgi:hypothetical protein
MFMFSARKSLPQEHHALFSAYALMQIARTAEERRELHRLPYNEESRRRTFGVDIATAAEALKMTNKTSRDADEDSDNDSLDEDLKPQAAPQAHYPSIPAAIAGNNERLPDCTPVLTPIQADASSNRVYNDVQEELNAPTTAHVGERAAVSMQHPLVEGMSSRERETGHQEDKRSSKIQNKSLEYHLKKDRGDPLCLGTAVNMLTLSLRCYLVNDPGFLYPEIYRSGTSTTFVSETFVQKHFSAVLKIHLGKLQGFRRNRGLVRPLLLGE